MKHYTTKEASRLLEILENDFSKEAKNKKYLIEITINKIPHCISIQDIYRTVLSCKPINYRVYKEVSSLRHFIHTVPLRNVPMYINTFPEAAKWRLEIGK